MIKVHNDGKEKLFSFEAEIVLDSVGTVGFGNTEQAAIEELKSKVSAIIKQLQGIDYSKRIYVDCFGNPLK